MRGGCCSCPLGVVWQNRRGLDKKAVFFLALSPSPHPPMGLPLCVESWASSAGWLDKMLLFILPCTFLLLLQCSKLTLHLDSSTVLGVISTRILLFHKAKLLCCIVADCYDSWWCNAVQPAISSVFGCGPYAVADILGKFSPCFFSRCHLIFLFFDVVQSVQGRRAWRFWVLWGGSRPGCSCVSPGLDTVHCFSCSLSLHLIMAMLIFRPRSFLHCYRCNWWC